MTEIPDYKQRRAEELAKSVRTMADLKIAILQGIRMVHVEREVTAPILMATLAELYAFAAVDFDVPFETFLDQTKKVHSFPTRRSSDYRKSVV